MSATEQYLANKAKQEELVAQIQPLADQLQVAQSRVGAMAARAYMGGQADATEDMFSKLESMRAVITEVNTQFKDPVCVVIITPSNLFYFYSPSGGRPVPHPYFTGEDDVRLRVHIRVPLTV